MKGRKDTPESASRFSVSDKRFWARKEGEVKTGERPPRTSDLPTYVEQLEQRMEAQRAKLKERLEQLDDEKSAFRKRLSDEMDRRLEMEKHRLAGILLEVMDHLDAAIATSELETNNSALLEGVKLTRDDLLIRLQKLGVSKMEALGQPFDPNYHEAVLTRKVPFDKDGEVIEVIQPGYAAGETVIRPAKVVVGTAEED
jgi:molecular chaperone GrpE